jgi:hypothetical protein
VEKMSESKKIKIDYSKIKEHSQQKSPLPKKEIQNEINALVTDSVETLWNYNSGGFILDLLFFRRNIRLMKDDKFIGELNEIQNEFKRFKKQLKKLQSDCKVQHEKEKNEIIVIHDVQIIKNNNFVFKN